ncbi:MAG TPA: DUF4389 domain-containing protein, partial [Steroidobacteraceae bacterium]|nr:DUF4389 domain-containing protein [Steroidobacteraceae bacterium]
MNQTPPPAPSDSNLTQRILYMLVFAVVFWILCWVIALTAVAQLVLRLVQGKPQADLTRFGVGLAAYTRQVIEYLTFASDAAPFP